MSKTKKAAIAAAIGERLASSIATEHEAVIEVVVTHKQVACESGVVEVTSEIAHQSVRS